MGKIVTMELKQWKLEEPQNMKKQEGNYQFW